MPVSLADLSPEDRESLDQELKALKEAQALKPTPSEEWKSPRQLGFLVKLPSGNVARIKRLLDLPGLLKNGLVPNPLASHIQKSLEEGMDTLQLSDLSADAQIQALDLIDDGVVRSMIEPRVLLVPEGINPDVFETPPGSISIMDLTLEDRMFVYQAAQGGTADPDRFRGINVESAQRIAESRRQPIGDVESPQPRKAAPKPTKRTNGTQRRNSSGKGK